MMRKVSSQELAGNAGGAKRPTAGKEGCEFFAVGGRKRAFTFIEISICVVLGALILVAITRVFSGTLKTSTKGSAHLTNVQATAIFLSQVVTDVYRACDLSQMLPNLDEPSAKLDIIEESETSGLATSSIIYEVAPDQLGIIRKRVPGTGLEPTSHIYCRNLQIMDCKFRRVDLVGGAIGFLVVLKTGTPPKGTEEFEIKRFILCRNHASNTHLLGW